MTDFLVLKNPASDKTIKGIPPDSADDMHSFSGHEYTIDNLEFISAIDPDNESAQNKLKWAQEQRKDKLCTVSQDIFLYLMSLTLFKMQMSVALLLASVILFIKSIH